MQDTRVRVLGVVTFMLAESATDVGVEDWARNHDHYLYGTDKR